MRRFRSACSALALGIVIAATAAPAALACGGEVYRKKDKSVLMANQAAELVEQGQYADAVKRAGAALSQKRVAPGARLTAEGVLLVAAVRSGGATDLKGKTTMQSQRKATLRAADKKLTALLTDRVWLVTDLEVLQAELRVRQGDDAQVKQGQALLEQRLAEGSLAPEAGAALASVLKASGRVEDAAAADAFCAARAANKDAQCRGFDVQAAANQS
jgi:hypothetical protein